ENLYDEVRTSLDMLTANDGMPLLTHEQQVWLSSTQGSALNQHINRSKQQFSQATPGDPTIDKSEEIPGHHLMLRRGCRTHVAQFSINDLIALLDLWEMQKIFIRQVF